MVDTVRSPLLGTRNSAAAGILALEVPEHLTAIRYSVNAILTKSFKIGKQKPLIKAVGS